jgi:4-aminobutyrate aminotransferase-like enzyme
MAFVVYSKNTGEIMRYYDCESKAQAQVTGHNHKAIMKALRGELYQEEWAVCEWVDYEKVFAQHYAVNKSDFLTRSAWR